MLKKILVIFFISLAIFLIYLGLLDNKVYYLSLGDNLATDESGYNKYIKDYLNQSLEKYVNYSDDSKRTTDIINDIKNNIDVYLEETKKMQNLLIKADLITISIGRNDFLTNFDFNYSYSIDDLYNRFEQVYLDIEELFTYLRKYSKEQIVIIGFYNYSNDLYLDEFYNYINNKMIVLCNEYNIEYIDLYEEFKNTGYISLHGVPNEIGYEKISELIIEKIK